MPKYQTTKPTKNRLQKVTVLVNHKTRQFYITFNNDNSILKGRKSILAKYNWIIKRIADIKSGKIKSTSRYNQSVLHQLDSSIMWAIHNSTVTDWIEQPLKKLYKLSDDVKLQRRLATKLEKLGYLNVRSRTSSVKGPAQNINPINRMPGNWGIWNPNTTLTLFKRKLGGISKSMNIEFPNGYVVRCWSEAIKPNGTIKNGADLWIKFEKDNIFQ